MQPVLQRLAKQVMGSINSDSSNGMSRTHWPFSRGPKTSESDKRPLRKLDEEVIPLPANTYPFSSTSVSAGGGEESSHTEGKNQEEIIIPLNAIRVKKDVALEHA